MTSRLVVDVSKVRENAARVVARCRRHGIRVVGVTKGACGLPAVARAMLAGGVSRLGDSRLDNIARLRLDGVEAPILYSRTPSLGDVARCVELADASAQVSVEVLEALSREAVRRGKRHGVLVMVDLDTGREGVLPERVRAFCRRVAGLENLEVYGLGAYFPNTPEISFYSSRQERLVRLKDELEVDLGIEIPVVSGGSSNIFTGMVLEGSHCPGINELRIGTAILVATAWTEGPRHIAGYHHDAFQLEAELIEIKERNGVGRGILGLGSLDTDIDHLYPSRDDIRIFEAGYDHTLVEFLDRERTPQVGDIVRFNLTYPSLCRLASSSYTRIHSRGEKALRSEPADIHIQKNHQSDSTKRLRAG